MNIKRLRTEVLVSPAGMLAIMALITCGILFWICALAGKRNWITRGRNTVSSTIMNAMEKHGVKASLWLWALIFVGIILKTVL